MVGNRNDNDIALSPDGARLAVGTLDAITIWDLKQRTSVTTNCQ
jgi:hypothetical protein